MQHGNRLTSEESNKISVSVIIPAYNEEVAIAKQIESIRQVLLSHGIVHEIIVVDDGSEDRTADLAFQAHARVLRHQENRGYGAALKTGIVSAKYDQIVMIDGDGTYPADQIPNLVFRLETADMVVGARTGDKVHIPWPRRPAKWLLGWLANRISGKSIPDLNSGLRAFRRDCVKQYFSILPNRFSFTTTVTMALVADDYYVAYQPVNYYKRVGKSKITPRHFMDFIVLVLRMAMLFQPLRVFLPLAFSCSFLGVLKAIYDIATLFLRAPAFSWSLFYQPLLSTSAILLLLVGLQLMLIGMVADGVLRRISQNNKPLITSRGILVPVSMPNVQIEKEDKVSHAEK